MVAKQVVIRNAVLDKIESDKTAFNSGAGYVIRNLELKKTYYPKEELSKLDEKVYVKFVCVMPATPRERDLRNPLVSLMSFGVQVAIQKRIDPTKTDEIDKLVELSEQIMTSCRDDELVANENWTWQRTEPLQDENGLIYSYEQLTVQGVFHVIFTVFYQNVLQ